MDQQFCQSVAAVTELRTTNSSSLSNSPTSSSSSQEASSSDVEQQELDKQRSTLKYQIMKASELASSGNISVFYKQGGLQPEFVPILPKSTTSNSSVEDQSPHQKVPQQNVDKVVATTPITFANRPGASHVTNNQLVTSSSSATAGKHQTDITEEASLQAKLEQKKALTVTPVKKHIPSNQQQKSVRSPVQAKLHQPTNHKQQIQPQVKPSVQQQVKPPTGQQQAKPSNVQQQVKPNTVQQVKSPAAQSKPNITPIQGIKTVVQSPKPQLTPVQGKKLLTVQIKQNQTAVQTKQAQQIQGKPIQPIKIKSAPVLVKTSLPNKHQGQNQFQVQSVVSVSKPSQISATKHPILQSNIQLKSLQQSPTPLLPKSIQLSSATSASIGGLQQTKTLQTAATTFTVTSKRPNTTLANSATPSKRPALLLDERNHLMPPASQAERSRKSYQSTKRKSKVVPLSDSDINKIGQFKLPSQVSAQPVQQTKQLNQQQNAAFQLKQQQQQSHLVSTIPLPPVTATVLPAGLSQAITLITHHNKLANVSTPNITETPQSTASVDKSFVLNQPPPTNETNGTFRILLVTDRETYTFNVDGSGEQLAENLQKVQGGCNKDVERVITESFKRQAMEAVKKQQQDTSNLVDSRISQDLQQLQSQIMEKDDETSPQPPHSPSPSKAETNYNEGRMALCHQCGFSSPSYDQCTRCKTKLPPDVKSIRMSPVTVPMSDSQSITVKRTNEVAVAVADSPKKRQKTTKRKKVEEPVCLTISSDDEDANDSRCNNFKLSDSGGAMDEAANSVVHQDPAITQSAMQKEPVITDEDEESIKDGEYQDPMETEMCDQIGAMKDDFDNLMNNSNEDSEWPIVLNCRTVRIGSYKVIPDDSVYITILGLFITMPSVAYESVRIEIPWFSVVKILAHFGKGMPVLFIYTTSAMGARIRKMLGMTDKNNSPYYDPASANESQRRITLLPENISVDCSGILKKLFSHLERTEYEELSQSEANDILVRASPKEVQNQIIKTVVKPQQTVMLPTDIQTIMVYPPPPAKGGIPINTEDYACLGEDQFLNDVIIDFYLKYIHQHFLSEKDQARTHILSTFFYKRLTTKPTSSRKSHNPVENDPKATAAEKRHSRVKSWTKSVDIFKKDFIIIPINEHSHWFLAVICFPGLTGPVDFETNQPMAVNDSKAKTKQQSTENNIDSKSVMAGKTSMTIGSTTITPVNTSPSQQQPSADTVTLLQPEEEDRDEADGEDEDFEQQTSSEEDVSFNEDQEAETDENKEPEQHVEEPIKENPEPVAEEKSKRSRKKEPRVPIKQPCILIFDSLATASRAKVVATLRDYLKVEYRVKHGVERQFTKEFMKGASPKVPQQTNYTDCGLYVLQYVEAFFQAPITDYHIPMKMLQEWFDVDLVSRKRYDIQQLLHKLMAEQGIDYSTLNLPELNLAPFHHGLVDYPSSDEMMGEEEDDEYQAYGDAYQAMCNDARFNGYREEEVVEDEEEDEEEVVDEEEEEEEEEDEDEEVDDDRMECDGDEVEEDLEDEEELDEECVGVRRNHSQCDDLDKELMDEVVPNVVGLKAFRIPRLKLLRQQQQQQQLLRDEQQLNQISFINCDSQPTCDDNE